MDCTGLRPYGESRNHIIQQLVVLIFVSDKFVHNVELVNKYTKSLQFITIIICNDVSWSRNSHLMRKIIASLAETFGFSSPNCVTT